MLKGGRKGDKEGWYRVSLRRKFNIDNTNPDKKRRFYHVLYPHRLVYQLFGPPKPKENIIYHINKCRDDNYIWNLADENKRFHKRRTNRMKKEGYYFHKRGKRYFFQRYPDSH